MGNQRQPDEEVAGGLSPRVTRAARRMAALRCRGSVTPEVVSSASLVAIGGPDVSTRPPDV